MTASWVENELRTANFGDARLVKRLIRMVTDFIARPMASVPQACADRAATKAVYRFWDSPRVSPEAIFAAHQDATIERLRGERFLFLIQDTTDLDFTTHDQTVGLGPLDNSHVQGLKMHSALVLNANGVPLGLLYQKVWARDPAKRGQAKQRRQRVTAEKESQRWLDTLSATEARLPADVESITIADREADIYDFLAMPRRANSQLLIRATHDRRVSNDGEYVWSTIRQSPEQGQFTVELRQQDGRPLRQANLTVRFCTLTLLPPRHHSARSSLQPIQVQAILAEEENAQVDQPISWLLLTTLPVDSFTQARQCIAWYSQRWLIERYHYVLKSGCQVEKLQLEEADRLKRAFATYCIVAWRLLWITYHSREQPEASCEVVFQPHEWQSLYATIKKTLDMPPEPPTLRQTVHWIAQLGGFQGRKGDGEPGVKTIWLGLRRLYDIANSWLLFRPPSSGPTYG